MKKVTSNSTKATAKVSRRHTTRKAIRIDQKDKVQEIIDSLRTSHAESERIGLDLDLVANMVKDFENPTIEEEEFLEVNDIRSFHGREANNIIGPIVNNKTLKWADKKKGLAYLSSASQPVQQEIDMQTLKDAANIVKILRIQQ